MLSVIKNSIFLILLSVSVTLDKCQDKRACEIYKQNLKIIKARLDVDEHQNLGEVYKSIKFFERITGIISHSDGDYFGRYNPTQEDYNNWAHWFTKNKGKLFWDENDKQVKVVP